MSINLPDRELDRAVDILARVLYLNVTGRMLEHGEEMPPELERAKTDFWRRLRFRVISADDDKTTDKKSEY